MENQQLNINLSQNTISQKRGEQTEPTERGQGSIIPINSFFMDHNGNRQGGDLIDQNRTITMRQESAKPLTAKQRVYNDGPEGPMDQPMSTYFFNKNNDTGLSLATGPRTISPRGQHGSEVTATRHPIGSLREVGDVQAVYS